MRSDRRLLMAACGLCMAAAAMLPGPTCIASSKYCAVTRAAPSHPTMIGGRLVKRVRRFFGKEEGGGLGLSISRTIYSLLWIDPPGSPREGDAAGSPLARIHIKKFPRNHDDFPI